MASSALSPAGLWISRAVFTCRSRDFKPLDKFPADELEIDDRTLKMLDSTRHIWPLTRANYQATMRSREEGAVGRGFTRDGLIAMGIIDQDDLETDAQATVDDDGKFVPPPGTEEYRGYLIVPRKQGKFTRFDAMSTTGGLLRTTQFQKVATAQKFIDHLIAEAKKNAEPKPELEAKADAAAAAEAQAATEAAASTGDEGSATPSGTAGADTLNAGGEEQGDGGQSGSDVQSDAVGSGEPGEAEDRGQGSGEGEGS